MPDLPRTQILVYLSVTATIGVVAFGALSQKPDRGDAPAGALPRSELRSGLAGAGAATRGDREQGLTLNREAGRAAIVVHVAGEVRRPGVFRLPAGSRAAAALRHAGGGTGKAALEQINLAAPLSDGQQVLVPATVPGTAAGTAGDADADRPVSLASATQEELEALDGIGPVTATRILEFRDSQGGAGSIEELDQVHGIGPVTMEVLRDSLTP